MSEFGCVPLKLYLQKHVLSWIWSRECGLLTPAIEKRTYKDISAGIFIAEKFEEEKKREKT